MDAVLLSPDRADPLYRRAGAVSCYAVASRIDQPTSCAQPAGAVGGAGAAAGGGVAGPEVEAPGQDSSSVPSARTV
ncbi:hypothetical protein P3T27_004719 [Kitasatospora sp. MAA19]|nr:hypothetical protein [Kitasatospora sp. MAA19]